MVSVWIFVCPRTTQSRAVAEQTRGDGGLNGNIQAALHFLSEQFRCISQVKQFLTFARAASNLNVQFALFVFLPETGMKNMTLRGTT